MEEEEDFLGSLIGVVAGVFLGLAGIALLENLLGYRCPHCKKSIQKNITICPHCHNHLRWK